MLKRLSFLVAAAMLAACGRPDGRHAPLVEGRHPLVVLPQKSKPTIPPLSPLSFTSVVTDPFWQLEREGFEAYGYGLADLTRTASPLVADGVVYAHGRGGTYIDCATADPADDCGPAYWDTIVHQVRAYTDVAGSPAWTYASSWKPQPGIYGLAGGFEPLFQFASSGDHLYVPEGNGRVSILARETGTVVTTVPSPLGGAGDADTYVTSPITVAPDGAGWYTVMALASNPLLTRDSWIVRMAPDGSITSRSLNTVVVQPANCTWPYDFTVYSTPPFVTPKPWPPAGGVIGPTFGCGNVTPQTNAAPAISVDGQSVIIVARNSRSDYTWLVRLNEADMSTMQQISQRDLLNDDCGVATPSTAQDGEDTDSACRVGTTIGVDRTTGLRPGPKAVHSSTSSPVALHDGGIALGTYSSYRTEQGHVLRFAADGSFLWATSFGWLVNPVEVSAPGIGGPSYRLLVEHSIYDDGPFWTQTLDSVSGARVWSYSEGFAGAGDQCLSKPGGKTVCLPVAGGGSSDFVARRPAIDAAGNIWTITSGGDVQQLSPTGVLLSSTHIAGGGDRMLDAPIVVDGTTVRVAYRGQLFTLTP